MSAASIRLAAWLLLASTLVGAPAWSQTLLDPTQPPPEARQGTRSAEEAPIPSGPQLQSVLLGNHGRQVAVIDGQALQVGEKIHGATLLKVGKDHVVLQRGRAQQILKLFPDARAGAPKPVPSAPVNSANK